MTRASVEKVDGEVAGAQGRFTSSTRLTQRDRLIGASVGAIIGAAVYAMIWFLRENPPGTLIRAMASGVIFGGLLGLCGFLQRLWSLRKFRPSSRTMWRTGCGAGIGGFLGSAIWMAQAAGPEGARAPLWGFMGGLAALGAFLGFQIGLTRARPCPHCGADMGRPQSISMGYRHRSANPEYQLELRTWRTEHGEGIEGYYLCPACDREFRVKELETQGSEEASSEISDLETTPPSESLPRAAKKAAKRKKKNRGDGRRSSRRR